MIGSFLRINFQQRSVCVRAQPEGETVRAAPREIAYLKLDLPPPLNSRVKKASLP